MNEQSYNQSIWLPETQKYHWATEQRDTFGVSKHRPKPIENSFIKAKGLFQGLNYEIFIMAKLDHYSAHLDYWNP